MERIDKQSEIDKRDNKMRKYNYLEDIRDNLNYGEFYILYDEEEKQYIIYKQTLYSLKRTYYVPEEDLFKLYSEYDIKSLESLMKYIYYDLKCERVQFNSKWVIKQKIPEKMKEVTLEEIWDESQKILLMKEIIS